MKNTGLEAIAILEGSKGLLSLLVGLGAHALIGENIRNIVEQLVSHFHLNPASHIPNILVSAASELTDSRLSIIAMGALVYTGIRFIEAYGLWHSFRWTEWFAFLSGTIYLPFEIYELIYNFNLLGTAVFLVNLFIVAYMYTILKKHPASEVD